MKKLFWTAASLLLAAMLSSCFFVVRGEVYIGYGWDAATTITSFYDTNSYVPATIVKNNYYRSYPGTYSAWYTTASASIYFRYTLKADYAAVDDPYGPKDAFFYIYLGETGAVFYAPTYRALPGAKALTEPEPSAESITKSPEAAPALSAAQIEALGAPSGVEEKTINGYVMRLEYWTIKK